MGDIKLFVCCHQPVHVPMHPLLGPIQVGAALMDSRFPGFLHDDTGDNISVKNRSYCELTAQYWAWKNVKAGYYGFFHYRRYLYPDSKAKLPYRVEREASLPLLNKLGYAEFERLIRQYDIIVPKGENMYVPIRAHYANAPYHHLRDLELAERIVREHYPEMVSALERSMLEMLRERDYLLCGRNAKDACTAHTFVGDYQYASVLMPEQDFDKFQTAISFLNRMANADRPELEHLRAQSPELIAQFPGEDTFKLLLGIIGSNGAGKSTLLKAVAGIMEPTEGKVKRKGNVAALLELGSGFDGDLTVKENTYLRGAMLGYTRKFMDETYNQIIDFAELWNFRTGLSNSSPAE